MANRPKTDTQETQTNTTASSAQATSSGASVPAFLTAALRIPTSYPLGAENVDNNTGTFTRVFGGSPSNKLDPVPGIMAIDYIPTYGVSYNARSALNRASFDQFNAIRSQISGNRPYEPADHMIYRYAVDGLRQLYMYVRRIYAIIRKYSATNLYKPVAVLTAMGLDAQSWMDHAADLYQWLLNNQGSLAPFPTVPVGIISARHELFNTTIFTDGGVETSQMYIMNQTAFWSYELVDEVKGLTLRDRPTTYDNFLSLWDSMYVALQSSSDVYTIAADIRRAFADRMVTSLPDTNADAVVDYADYAPIKMSIMNACVLGSETSLDDKLGVLTKFRIYDQDGILKCTPDFIVNEDAKYTTTMLNHFNSVTEDPNGGEILEYIRFKPVITTTNEDGSYRLVYESMGTEVLYSAHITGYVAGELERIEVPSMLNLFSYNFPEERDEQLRDVASTLNMLSKLSNFDWHMPVYIHYKRENSDDGEEISGYLVEDIQNYVPISNENLKTIHDAVLLWQFGF